MHGNDPVNWQRWESSLLQQAQQQNKLIFISSGYFACHWCHVMQRENYKNTQTANFLNQHFLSVKIDRELNPELDNTLIEFAQQATGQAGWPQHVILTPEGYPFAAFIYLPNNAFQKTLQRIVDLWKTQPQQILRLAKRASKSKPTPRVQDSAFYLTAELFKEQLIQQTNLVKDDLSGGLKGSSKFPKAPLLNALLQIDQRPKEIDDWLIVTLDHMQDEHLFDHVHGGFYRYSIDPEWQTPHFEKMLYDNALLASTYLTAGRKFHRDDYLETAQATLKYVQNHLYSSTTQMYQGSQSAIDKNHIEGGDYLWSKTQLQNTLSTEEYQSIDQAWSLNNPPPYELGWHPLPIEPEAKWRIIRQKLQKPVTEIPIDSKSILGWNGLLLSSLSQAWKVFEKPEYQISAQQLASRLSQLILQSTPPRALSGDGSAIGEANLQDYAYILQGLKDYQTSTGDLQFNKTIQLLKKIIPDKFYGTTGWQYGTTKILPQQTGQWIMADGPIPSPAALVSCDKPQSLIQQQDLLLAQALNYPSYLSTLSCIQPPANPVK